MNGMIEVTKEEEEECRCCQLSFLESVFLLRLSA